MTPRKTSLPAKRRLCICGKPDCKIPYGYCHCTCGEKTSISKESRPNRHLYKGEPITWIYGHSRRIAHLIPKAKPFKYEGRLCCWIPLTKGWRSLVFACHYKVLSKRRWHAVKIGNKWYAFANNLSLHREIIKMCGVKLSFKDKVDHPFGQTLDNRACMLRIGTNMQNLQNAVLSRANTSGYKGVTWNKNERKWMAQLVIFGRPTIVLRTHDKIKAAYAYDEAARKHFGQFACVNFPRRGERGARITGNARSSSDNQHQRRFRSPRSQNDRSQARAA